MTLCRKAEADFYPTRPHTRKITCSDPGLASVSTNTRKRFLSTSDIGMNSTIPVSFGNTVGGLSTFCRAMSILTILPLKHAHLLPWKENYDIRMDVSFADRFGAMSKLRDFWFHYGDDIFLVFFTVDIFLGVYFLLTVF